MSYGSSAFEPWMLDEEESIAHIKRAYDLGINTFDTADVYGSGLSEIVLGKAIKKHQLPRDEIVVMTKVFGTVGRDPTQGFLRQPKEELFKMHYVNQQGLSRKASMQFF